MCQLLRNVYFSEEVILAEERTTEEQRMHILEGPYNATYIMNIQFPKDRKDLRSELYLRNVLVHIYTECFECSECTFTRISFDTIKWISIFFFARNALDVVDKASHVS